jgi:hypothetical protein
MNEMYLVLGDPSQDGHGHSDKLLFKVNKSIKEVQQAYKDSCKLTGISFNHNEDYTERKRTWEEWTDYRICTEYDDCILSKEILKVLKDFGYPDLNIFKKNPYLDEEIFYELWFWFVELSLPDLIWEYKIIEDNIPIINTGGLNVQFGYGLYNI